MVVDCLVSEGFVSNMYRFYFLVHFPIFPHKLDMKHGATKYIA